jgi:hypothetical protein
MIMCCHLAVKKERRIIFQPFKLRLFPQKYTAFNKLIAAKEK